MKIMNKVDKQVLLALSAPMGFVILTTIIYYLFKRISVITNLSILKIPAGFEVFIIIPIAAIFGSYLGARLAKMLIKTKIPLLFLSIGALVGYELGIGLEFLFLRLWRLPLIKELQYYFAIVVLMSGFLGALIGARITKEKEQ
ncbi:MAG: hypothetical protein AB1629_01355 [Candidatus Omnitrophota bacterium]